MSDAKQRMIDSAVVLLATRGLQATSFSEVLAHSGAPRGSVYHHFPEGKDELVAAAVDLAGDRAIRTLEAHAGEPARAIAGVFLGMWRDLLVVSHERAGCSVTAVTVAGASVELLDHARDVFRAWRSSLARLLEQGGASEPEAKAAVLIAASEGAVVVARAERDLAAFDLVAEELLARF
jgi:AcrR family transcriptional regulator